ncbi:MAG TPA: hypothetical protein PLO23_04265, partial [Alphaproteobacteria bacterium]|nr:hypothetical protein [Alphaproteobacteria bacterium]
GGHWSAHDLRRTSATIMQELGVFPHIIKKCLNQRIGDLIAETYQQANLWEMQQEAFNRLGDYLSTIRPQPDFRS